MGIGRIINNNNIIIILVYGCKVQTPPTPSFSISIYPIAKNSVTTLFLTITGKLCPTIQSQQLLYLKKILA